MSEEQPTQNTQTEKKCKFTLLIILTIISLLFSVSSLVLSIITYNGGISIGQQGEDSNKISVRYDKGRSFEKASKKNKPIIVFFYTDWCGFCQRFAPTFDKVTKDAKIKKEFAIAYVNCEKPENQKLMEEYGVQGFPTVFVINTDGTKKQLENATFFNNDSQATITKDALSVIGK